MDENATAATAANGHLTTPAQTDGTIDLVIDRRVRPGLREVRLFDRVGHKQIRWHWHDSINGNFAATFEAGFRQMMLTPAPRFKHAAIVEADSVAAFLEASDLARPDYEPASYLRCLPSGLPVQPRYTMAFDRSLALVQSFAQPNLQETQERIAPAVTSGNLDMALIFTAIENAKQALPETHWHKDYTYVVTHIVRQCRVRSELLIEPVGSVAYIADSVTGAVVPESWQSCAALAADDTHEVGEGVPVGLELARTMFYTLFASAFKRAACGAYIRDEVHPPVEKWRNKVLHFKRRGYFVLHIDKLVHLLRTEHALDSQGLRAALTEARAKLC